MTYLNHVTTDLQQKVQYRY